MKLVVIYKNILDEYKYKPVFRVCWDTLKTYEMFYEVSVDENMEEVWNVCQEILEEKGIFVYSYLEEKEDFIQEVDPKVLLCYLVLCTVVIVQEIKQIKVEKSGKEVELKVKEEELLELKEEEEEEEEDVDEETLELLAELAGIP